MATKNRTRASARGSLNERDEVTSIRELLQEGQPVLDDYWKVGEQMRRLEADAAVSGRPGWRVAVARAAGGAGRKSTLDKALRLRKLYPTKAELEELKRAEDRWSFVLVALGVAKTKARHAILRKARQENWSAERLQAEVQARKGGVRGGGRPRALPEATALAPDLQRLLGLLEDLHHFYERVWKGYEQEVAAVADEDDPGINGRRLDAVLAKVGDLPATVKEVVGQLAKLNRRLKARKGERAE